jgi:hypothetical protein
LILVQGCAIIYFLLGDTQMPIPTSKQEANAALKEGYVDVVFTKKNGTNRKMIATLLPEVIASAKHTVHGIASVTVPDHQIRCIDTELGEWRSFTLDSITSFEPKQN